MKTYFLLIAALSMLIFSACNEEENFGELTADEIVEPIAVSSLPENSQSYIDFTYPDASVEEAYLIIADENLNFEAVLDNTIRPVFSEEGVFQFNRDNFINKGFTPGRRPQGKLMGHGLPGDSISVEELPERINTYLIENYAENEILGARKIERPNGDMSYSVLIDEIGLALFDSEGAFIKNIEKPNHSMGKKGPAIQEIELSALPQPITDYLTSEYAGSTIDKAGIHEDREGIVTYALKLEGVAGVLIFDESGNFIEHKEPQYGRLPHPASEFLEADDIPQGITDYITSNYPDDAIENARVVERPNGEILYIIKLIMNGIIRFDENGQFIG